MEPTIERKIKGYRIKIGSTEIKMEFRTRKEAERYVSNRLAWRSTYGRGIENDRLDNTKLD